MHAFNSLLLRFIPELQVLQAMFSKIELILSLLAPLTSELNIAIQSTSISSKS
jgi:hypothetical protein